MIEKFDVDSFRQNPGVLQTGKRTEMVQCAMNNWYGQWLKWSCEAGGGSPDEARLEQTTYSFHTQLMWRYLGIK